MFELLLGDLFALGIIASTYYVLMRIAFYATIIFAIIGLITTIRWIIGKTKKKETPGEKWMRTGRL